MSERKGIWRRLGRSLLAGVLLAGVGAMSSGCIFVEGGHHHHHHWHDEW